MNADVLSLIDRTINSSRGWDNVIDSHNMAAVCEPVESNVSQDVDKPSERNDHRNTGVGSIGNSTLDWREESATSNTHDQDTSTTAGVASEVGSTQSKDRWVHRSLKEVEEDQDDDSRLFGIGADDSIKNDSEDSVDNEEEISLENPAKCKREEAADRECNEGV